MKNINKKKSISGWGIFDKNGNLVTDRKQIVEVWADFYTQLYADQDQKSGAHDKSKESRLSNVDVETLKIPRITLSETKTAIRRLKQSKSPGLDGICAEFLKAGGEEVAKEMTLMFNDILNTEKIPQEFKDAEIVVIHKKGSQKECSNYHPISLLSHIYKAFITIICEKGKIT